MSGVLVRDGLRICNAQRAMGAWRNLTGATTNLPEIDTLQEKKYSAAYRLRAAGRQREDVIAKWFRIGPASVEREVYENLLPHLDPQSLRYFGSVADDTDGFRWLFVEEAKGSEYNSALPAHRSLAAGWLAQIHSHGRKVAGRHNLVAFSFGACRCQADRTAGRIASHMGNHALSEDDRTMLNEVIDQCSRFASSCNALEQASATAPPTLVHGDFVPKNMRIRNRQLLVFDWEMSCWGPPAADLAECDDLQSYQAASDLSSCQIQMLALIGKCLRWMSAVDWASWGLEGSWVRKPLRNLRCYCQDMRQLSVRLQQSGLSP